MKKILLTLIAVTFVSSLCFAQAPIAHRTETFKGKIEIAKPGILNPPKFASWNITVVSDNGGRRDTTLNKDTNIIDFYGKSLKLKLNSETLIGKRVELNLSYGEVSGLPGESVWLNSIRFLDLSDRPIDFFQQKTSK